MKEGKLDANTTSCHKDRLMRKEKRQIKRRKRMVVQSESLSVQDSVTERNWEPEQEQPVQWQQWDWDSEQVPAVSHIICIMDHKTAMGIVWLKRQDHLMKVGLKLERE